MYTPSVNATKVSSIGSEDLADTTKPGSLSGRKAVRLPASSELLSDWEKIGVTWLESVENHPFLAEALLPEGWEARDNPSHYSGHSHVTLLDSEHIPRVNMFIKKTYYDTFASATFLTKEKGERQLQKEVEMAETERKRNEEAEHSKNVVLSKRSETWSEECPFGVFFVKDMSEWFSRDFVKEPIRRSCHGFFPTEEIAKQAQGLLKKSSDLLDSVFTKKIDCTNLHTVQTGYKIVNGFTDTSWWGTFTW